MTIRSLAATLTVAGAVAALCAPAAQAAPVTRSFDFRTASGFTDGFAHAYGNLTFTTRNKATLTGRLNDNCPEDGLGAYLDVTVFYGSGGQDVYHAKDAQGCKDKDGVAYSFTFASAQGISSVRLILREKDVNGSKVGDDDRWLSVGNPKY
jgi:hypothetical protein